MEDTTKQPLTADASLYNGQPFDTGLSCQSAELTFRTPSISKDIRNGVSVENVPLRNKQWFVLRASYGRVQKVQEYLEEKGPECYAPQKHKQVNKQIVTEPLLPSFLSVHTTSTIVDSVLHDDRINPHESCPLLKYYYDHTAYRSDYPDHNPPLTIRDEAMNNFIHLTSIKNPHIIPVTSENIQFKLGDKVVVTEGEFKGVHGRVARIAGQQRAVVELFDGCFVATAYVPKEAMINF